MGRHEPARRASSRRRVLRILGGAGLAALAGCSGGTSSDPAGGTTVPTTRPAATPRDTTDPGTETPERTPTAEPVDVEALEGDLTDRSFEGNLFDTHAHWAGARDAGHEPLDPGTFAARMRENGVGACVLFTSSVDAAKRYPSVLEQLATADVPYLPFLQPQNRAHLVEGEVASVYSNHAAAFAGIGEIVFYGGPMEGTALTDDPWPALFEFAAGNGVPLMIHPTRAQEDGLQTMLSEYPDATVLAHGGEFNLAPGRLTTLLENHGNLYWTVDAGSMLNGLVLTAADADEFASRYDQRADEFEQLVGQVLPPVVAAAPDRVMWGTDLATAWNTDPQVYSRVMDWTKAALEALPAEHRPKYAAENARRLFGL